GTKLSLQDATSLLTSHESDSRESSQQGDKKLLSLEGVERNHMHSAPEETGRQVGGLKGAAHTLKVKSNTTLSYLPVRYV
ncbi:MAG: hypothetical protein KJO28_01865, partial [Desulfofustis sp.]|nr:hypothetical protein [Desulfofustis sp.]